MPEYELVRGKLAWAKPPRHKIILCSQRDYKKIAIRRATKDGSE